MTILVFSSTKRVNYNFFMERTKTPLQAVSIQTTMLISLHSQGDNMLFAYIWPPGIWWLVLLHCKASHLPLLSIKKGRDFNCIPKTIEYLATCIKVIFALIWPDITSSIFATVFSFLSHKQKLKNWKETVAFLSVAVL